MCLPDRSPVLSTLLLAFAVAVVVGGCSDGGRAARIASAIDVRGNWVLAGDDRFHIRIAGELNEPELTVDREDDVIGDDENALIARLVDPADQLFVRSALVVGREIDVARTELDGGGNVSFDGGATTTVRVVTPALPARAAADDDGDVISTSLRWGFALDGDARRLEGSLFVTTLQERVTVGGDGRANDVARLDIPLTLLRE